MSQSRLSRDDSDTKKLVHELERFQVFDRSCDRLVVISTSDVAPDDIAAELLDAELLGERKVLEFVKERLQDKSLDFYSTMKRKNPKTLQTMYQVKVNTKDGKEMTKTVKADRALLEDF